MSLAVENPPAPKKAQKDLQCAFRASAAKRRGNPPGHSPATPLEAAVCTPVGEVLRSRQAHTKSRFGCRNCKSKRVKCDESRSYGGGCRRCSLADLRCDYLSLAAKPLTTTRGALVKDSGGVRTIISDGSSNPSSSTASQSSGERSLSLSVTRQSSPVVGQISWSPELPIYEAQADGMPSSRQVLHHFRTMTATTVGDYKSQAIAQSRVIATALHSPYLMHAILGLAAAHIRYLLPPEAMNTNAQLRVAECSHWAKAFEGFRRELAGPTTATIQVVKHQSNVNKLNMDQLLSTVMFVSMHQFSLRDDSGATTDQQGAPRSFVWRKNRAARETALKWLGVQAGFKGLLPAMQPWLMESFWLPIFGAVDFSDEFSLAELGRAASNGEDSGSVDMDQIDFHFVKMCGIDKNPTDSNPYFVTLEIVLWCRRLRPISAETFPKLLNFVARMPPEFQNLLLDLDTAALLILAHWLLLFHEIGQWWISSRAVIEIREIARFLSSRREEESQERRVRLLLREPAAAVGLGVLRHNAV